MNSRLDDWIRALEERHLADLKFSEVARALRAVSSAYVERRAKIAEGAALSGAGKRAAFALFYGPIHYLIVREIVAALPGATSSRATLVDLGCGTGAAGVAWAGVSRETPTVLGFDRHPWALAEAKSTYREFGLAARTRLADMASVSLPKPSASILAAFSVNELSERARDRMLAVFLERAARGDQILIVEPIARFVTPWWGTWQLAFEAAGGRADQWRTRVELPAIVAKLDRAAGLNHRELTARSLWIGAERTP